MLYLIDSLNIKVEFSNSQKNRLDTKEDNLDIQADNLLILAYNLHV